jgi:hypothetical protein
MSIENTISIALTAIGMLAALIVWAMRATVAPLKVVIQNNTSAMERIITKLDDHDDKLDDHGNRITRIETTHRVRHGDEEE